MSFNIIVCVKQVPDPEGPPTSYEVNEPEKQVVTRGISPVINPFDENALEAAIRIKETREAKITLLSMGKSLSRAVLLKAMATGVDEAVLVEGDEFNEASPDSGFTAGILAEAIKKCGDFNLILTGRQASDTNSGQVGTGIAQILDIPALTLAQKVEVSGDSIVVERILPDGFETAEAPLPALVTVSGELGDLRYPSMPAIKAAKKLPQTVLSQDELQITGEKTVETVLLKAPSRERSCEFIEADAPEEAGKKLALKLREDKVL